MSIPHLVARRLAAIAACAVLTATAPAHAAVIASFDPAFGPAIPNLGFRGSITLDVTAGCYALGPGFRYTGGACQITAQTAHIDYYNATTDPTATTILSSVDLGAPFFPSFYVFGAYFDPLTGQLAGLDTFDSGIFAVSVTGGPPAPINYTGNMALLFSSGMQPPPVGLLSADASAAAAVPGVGGAFLRNCVRVVEGSCVTDPFNTSLPARLVFNAVPEPDSVALLLLAAGMLAVVRRRKPLAR